MRTVALSYAIIDDEEPSGVLLHFASNSPHSEEHDLAEDELVAHVSYDHPF